MKKMNEQQPRKKLSVIINQINPQQVVAEAHGQKITLSIVGDPNAGLTAPETVLTALGTCIVSNIKKGAREMGLCLDNVAIAVTAEKRIDPLGLSNVQFVVTLSSSESKEKLHTLYERATTNGTATNALLEGIKPQSKLKIQSQFIKIN
jgi:uncharacterized OsmC-like protein